MLLSNQSCPSTIRNSNRLLPFYACYCYESLQDALRNHLRVGLLVQLQLPSRVHLHEAHSMNSRLHLHPCIRSFRLVLIPFRPVYFISRYS